MHFHCFSDLFVTFLIHVILFAPFSYTGVTVLPLIQSLHNNSTYFLRNISSLLPPDVANTARANGDGYRRYCATPAEWKSTEIDSNQCRSAVKYLYFVEVMTTDYSKSYEFMAPGARKTTKSKGQWTFLKYNFSKTSSSWNSSMFETVSCCYVTFSMGMCEIAIEW